MQTSEESDAREYLSRHSWSLIVWIDMLTREGPDQIMVMAVK